MKCLFGHKWIKFESVNTIYTSTHTLRCPLKTRVCLRCNKRNIWFDSVTFELESGWHETWQDITVEERRELNLRKLL